jgi:CheY-like chemotaxis protein
MERMHRKKILILENYMIVAILEREILEAEGFEVEVAGDGVEGLEKIKQNRYDVIISDCNIPRMRATELYLEVKNLSPDLAKRIIFVSGIITDFIKSTGNRVLKKPFSPQQLIEAVKELI